MGAGVPADATARGVGRGRPSRRPRGAATMGAVVRVVHRYRGPILALAAVLAVGAAWKVRGFGPAEIETDFSKLRRADTWQKGEGYWGRKMDGAPRDVPHADGDPRGHAGAGRRDRARRSASEVEASPARQARGERQDVRGPRTARAGREGRPGRADPRRPDAAHPGVDDGRAAQGGRPLHRQRAARAARSGRPPRDAHDRAARAGRGDGADGGRVPEARARSLGGSPPRRFRGAPEGRGRRGRSSPGAGRGVARAVCRHPRTR